VFVYSKKSLAGNSFGGETIVRNGMKKFFYNVHMFVIIFDIRKIDVHQVS